MPFWSLAIFMLPTPKYSTVLQFGEILDATDVDVDVTLDADVTTTMDSPLSV